MSQMTMEALAELHAQTHDAHFDYLMTNPAGPGMWVLACHDDGPAVCGGGLPGLDWMPDYEAMMDFFAEHFFVIRGFRHKDGDLQCYEEVRAVARRVRTGELGRKEAIAHLNPVLTNRIQLEWWGTFEDLCHSEDTYCRAMREHFRNGEEDEELEDDAPHAPVTLDRARPVAAEEIARFIEYLGFDALL